MTMDSQRSDVLPIPHCGMHEGHRNNQDINSSPKMSNRNTQIYNVTTKGHMKLNQAEKAVADGLCAWLDKSDQRKGIRKLSLSEMVAIRSEMARAEATRHLEASEIHGLRYETPNSPTWQESHLDAQNRFRGCLKLAREYALTC
jgi:hypothetical protein